jgi:glycosyltransferase involved in cell wall biosynthesis
VTRLLQAMAGAQHGGAEAFFTRLAIALQRDGQPQLCLIRRDAERAALLRAAGVAVVEAPFGGWLDFRTGRRFARTIETYRPDVVLTWMNRATERCPRQGSGDRFVHVARLGGYYRLSYYAACDHLIGNTRDIVRYLVHNGWPASRAHYLPNFVEPVMMAPVPRAALDTPDDVPVILALVRLHTNKGFDILIAALEALPTAHLWLAGEGPERAALQAVGTRLGSRLHFIGWRDDVPALMAAADILVCPSRHEPLGNVVLEGWAQGIPVVAAASAGPASLIRDGVDGLLVPIEDATALAGAISRVLADPDLAASLASEGRRSQAAEYGTAAVVARYRAFLDRVAV